MSATYELRNWQIDKRIHFSFPFLCIFFRLKRFLPRKVDKIAVKEDNLIGVKNDWSSSLHQNLILSPKRGILFKINLPCDFKKCLVHKGLII